MYFLCYCGPFLVLVLLFLFELRSVVTRQNKFPLGSIKFLKSFLYSLYSFIHIDGKRSSNDAPGEHEHISVIVVFH